MYKYALLISPYTIPPLIWAVFFCATFYGNKYKKGCLLASSIFFSFRFLMLQIIVSFYSALVQLKALRLQ